MVHLNFIRISNVMNVIVFKKSFILKSIIYKGCYANKRKLKDEFPFVVYSIIFLVSFLVTTIIPRIKAINRTNYIIKEMQEIANVMSNIVQMILFLNDFRNDLMGTKLLYLDAVIKQKFFYVLVVFCLFIKVDYNASCLSMVNNLV